MDCDEAWVDSCRAEGGPTDAVRRRLADADLVWHHVLASEGGLALPYSMSVESDDRIITVEGELLSVPGMRIAANARWVGMVRPGKVTVKITTDSEAPLLLRACAEHSSLPEFPPDAH